MSEDSSKISNVVFYKGRHCVVKSFSLQKWKILCSGVSGEDTRHTAAPSVSEAFCAHQQNEGLLCVAGLSCLLADVDWCEYTSASALLVGLCRVSWQAQIIRGANRPGKRQTTGSRQGWDFGGAA